MLQGISKQQIFRRPDQSDERSPYISYLDQEGGLKPIAALTPTWRLALGLGAAYVVITTIRLAVHEIGHTLMAVLVGGTVEGWFLAPGVVGYSWSMGNILSPGSDVLVKLGGEILTTLIGILLIPIALDFRRRRPGWAAFCLSLSAVHWSTNDLLYLGTSVLLKWGDGYLLMRQGVSPIIFTVIGIAAFILSAAWGMPWAMRSLAPYLPLTLWRRYWALLVAMIVPLSIYGCTKAVLFFPELATHSLIRNGAMLSLIALEALLGWPYLAARKTIVPTQRTLSMWAPLVWLAIAVGIEVFCTLYFGLVAQPRW